MARQVEIDEASASTHHCANQDAKLDKHNDRSVGANGELIGGSVPFNVAEPLQLLPPLWS